MRIVRLRSIVAIGWDSMAETRKVAYPWSFDSHKVKISSIVDNAADSRTASNDKLPSLRLPGCPVEYWGTALVVSSPSKPMPSYNLRLRVAASGRGGKGIGCYKAWSSLYIRKIGQRKLISHSYKIFSIVRRSTLGGAYIM
jgi:hypothetical protein